MRAAAISFARSEGFHRLARCAFVALRTALFEWHRAAGARMIEFGGWEMPLQYSGIVDEHLAVRRAVGLFDVSHMGKIFVEGPTAHAFLDRLSANDVPTLAGKARYTHVLREDGTILDYDIITFSDADRLCIIGLHVPCQ